MLWLATLLALAIAVSVIGPPLVSAADTGQGSPSANSNEGWVGPDDVYESDDNRAAADRTEDIVDYYNFNLPAIPSSSAITGIEVSVEGYQTGGYPARQADISLSWDSGSSYTTGAGAGVKTTDMPGNDSASEAIRIFGGAADTWGRTWAPADFCNDRFRVRLDTRLADYGTHLYIDHLQVRITYLPGPVIEGVTPGSARQGDSVSIVLAGSGLSGTSDLTVGAGVRVDNFTVDGPTQITAHVTVSPSATPGFRDITITNSIGSVTLPGVFVVNPRPVAGFGAERPTVYPDQEVQFVNRSAGDLPPLSFQWDFNNDGIWDSSDNNPSYAYALPGSYSVVLKVTDSALNTDMATMPDFIIVGRPAPDVTSLSPTQGMAGEFLNVLVSGTDFTDATSVSFGAGITVIGYTVDSSSRITADIMIDPEAVRGLRSVSIQTPRGCDTLTGFSVTLPAPVVEVVGPRSGFPGERCDIVISGTGFNEARMVDFGPGIAVKYFTTDSDNQITAHVAISPDAKRGVRDVTVMTASGACTLDKAFSVEKKAVSLWIWAMAIAIVALPGVIPFLLIMKRRKKEGGEQSPTERPISSHRRRS